MQLYYTIKSKIKQTADQALHNELFIGTGVITSENNRHLEGINSCFGAHLNLGGESISPERQSQNNTMPDDPDF